MVSVGQGAEFNDFTEAWNSANVGRVNLAILGGAGVGKSTLVNTIFGADLAPTGVGEPVTKGVQYYSKENVGLYDFQGVENFEDLGNFVKNFQKIYQERIVEDSDSAIHAVWYCIKASDLRFDHQQEHVIKLLAEMGLPVVLVMTRTRYRQNQGIDPTAMKLIDHVRSRELPVVTGAPIPVAALADDWDGAEAFGLEHLITETVKVLPDGQKTAFASAQKVDDGSKSREANRLVVIAGATAATVAATPIPLADAPVLVTIQGAMMAKVAKIYGIEMSAAMVAKGLAGIAAVHAGRALSSSLIGLFPGVGNAINASVAAGITLALGKAWAELCRMDSKGELNLIGLADQGVLAETLFTHYANYAKGESKRITST